MDETVKKLWIDDLRSGKSQQCRSYLRKVDAFCCLGRLLDVLHPDGWRGRVGVGHDHVKSKGPFSDVLSDAFLQKVGLDYQFMIDLANANDGNDGPLTPRDANGMLRPATFAEIADIVERLA